jgi:hypothetical protein
MKNTPGGFFRVLMLAALAVTAHAQVSIVTSYTQNFDSLGTALPSGWGVWTSSTSTGNGSAYAWTTTQIANNASVTGTNTFRNLPGASQTWTSGLTAGSDRALGWRASTIPTRTGSITFTLSDTSGWNFSAMSFQLFTPNNTGAIGTYQLQYQIGTSGTFSQLGSFTYSNDTAANPLVVASISLTSGELASINNKSSQVTLRFVNTDTSTSAYRTLAIDNFSYSATAIPEPATYAAILGAVALAGATWRRRRQRKAG